MVDSSIRVVFMGTPSFCVPVLEGLIQNYNVVLVVVQPDRKKNRHGDIIIPDAKRVALEHGIDVFQPEKVRVDYQRILDACPDIIVTCAYGQIIPDVVLNYPKYGCINVHGSLLPLLRGGAPIHWALIRGFQETGITIMRMNSKMDGGDIISQEKLLILEDDNLDSLYDKMSLLASSLLLKTLPSILDNSCEYCPQDESKVSFGYNITKEDAKIDFTKSSREVFNLVRGLSSVPGAYCFLDGMRVKIFKVEECFDEIGDDKALVGEIVDVRRDSFVVKCGSGYVSVLDMAQEGRKRCSVRDYLNGVNGKSLIGKVFC